MPKSKDFGIAFLFILYILIKFHRNLIATDINFNYLCDQLIEFGCFYIFITKAFFALSFNRKSPNFYSRRISSHKTLMLAYIHPRQGARSIYRHGVGVDCLFRLRRLAMPLLR